MKKKSVPMAVTAYAAFLALLGACAMTIPHPVDGRADCLACHSRSSAKPYPSWHAKRNFGDEKCLKCHRLERDGQ